VYRSRFSTVSPTFASGAIGVRISSSLTAQRAWCLADKLAISGAQETETFLDVFRKVASGDIQA